MSADAIKVQIARIRTLLQERLRIKGATLERQIKKSGRLLPRRLRGDAQYVAQAAGLLENPKLSRMVDVQAVGQAATRVESYLREIDPGDLLRGRILVLLGKISAVLIFGFVIAVWIAVERGLI